MSSQPRRTPSKKKKMRVYTDGNRPFPIWAVPVIITCVAVLVVVFFFVSQEYTLYAQYRAAVARVNVETLYPGITINGVDVGGMRIDEARAAIGEGDLQAISDFSIVIESGDRRWRITSQEVPLAFDTDAVLAKAYALGRSGNLQERYAALDTLEKNGVSLRTGMGYDKEKVRELTDIVASRLTVEPTNAKLYAFEVATHAFTFTEAEPGYRVDADGLYRDVVAALDAGNYNATITPKGEATQPTITKEMLSSMFGLISTFTTETTADKNRNQNIALSSAAINGKVVLPGEIFSFNDCTGQRTTDKGYREAGAISGGVLVDETGGGVCQTSSTLFNAVIRADLEIIDRSAHSWPATYVPKGEDAAVDWPRLDFQFKNNQDTPVFVIAWYEDKTVTVQIYGKLPADGTRIDLASELIKTMKPSDDVLYTQDESLPAGTSKAGRKKRTGYIVDTYKVYYDREGTEINRSLLWRTTYKATQKEILFN